MKGCVAEAIGVVINKCIVISRSVCVCVSVGEQMVYVEGGGAGDDDAGGFLDCAVVSSGMCGDIDGE